MNPSRRSPKRWIYLQLPRISIHRTDNVGKWAVGITRVETLWSRLKVREEDDVTARDRARTMFARSRIGYIRWKMNVSINRETNRNMRETITKPPVLSLSCDDHR